MLAETRHTAFWNVEWRWLAVCYELPTSIMQHCNRLKTSNCTVAEASNLAQNTHFLTYRI